MDAAEWFTMWVRLSEAMCLIIPSKNDISIRSAHAVFVHLLKWQFKDISPIEHEQRQQQMAEHTGETRIKNRCRKEKRRTKLAQNRNHSTSHYELHRVPDSFETFCTDYTIANSIIYQN